MTQSKRYFPFILVLALALAGCAAPALQTAGTAEEVRLSTPRLKEMSAAFQSKVERGEIPGVVLLVARDNKIAWFDAIGYRDREANAPMARDSLFRMASMTKPLTSLSIMMLQEEGKLSIHHPVSRYLPELRNLQVGVEAKGSDGRLELTRQPAGAEITIVDLLRHTSGITYGIFGKSMVKDLYNGAKLFDPRQTSGEFITKISALPLQFAPGTRWDYGMSTDVLARVVEVVSGMEMDRFVEARILKPLGMKDSGYWVDASRLGRVAEPQVIAATGKRPAFPSVSEKPRWTPGGHGLVSTATDYARFCQMLLNGGTLDGVRIASPETIDLMRKDHLAGPMLPPPPVREAFGVMAPGPENGTGFGLGFLVRTGEGTNKIPGSVGDISWGGAQGTYFWVDPKERMFAILMLQAPIAVNRPLRLQYREHVYGALRK